jgi:hypothetical protein
VRLRRPLAVIGAVCCLIFLSLGLNSCGSSSPSTPVAVPPPSYKLTAAPLNPGAVTAGNTTTSIIAVTPDNGYTGIVSLSCGNISGGSQVPTCSFSTNPVVVNGTAAGTSTLTVSTSADTSGGSYSLTITAKDAKSLSPSNGAQSLNFTTAVVIQRVVVIFQENRTPDNLFQDPVLIAS